MLTFWHLVLKLLPLIIQIISKPNLNKQWKQISIQTAWSRKVRWHVGLVEQAVAES